MPGPTPPPFSEPTCPHCGGVLSGAATAVCPHCGRSQIAAPPVAAPPPAAPPPPPPSGESAVPAASKANAPLPEITTREPKYLKTSRTAAGEASPAPAATSPPAQAAAPPEPMTAEQKARLRRRVRWVIAVGSGGVLLVVYLVLLALS